MIVSDEFPFLIGQVLKIVFSGWQRSKIEGKDSFMEKWNNRMLDCILLLIFSRHSVNFGYSININPLLIADCNKDGDFLIR